MINSKFIKNIPLYIGFLFLALISIRTISNPLFWTHLSYNKLGNLTPSYLQSEQIINTSYLYDYLLQLFFNLGGPTLVIILNVIGIILAFYLFLKASNKLASNESITIALLFSGIILFRVIDVTPLTIMLIMIASFFNILQKRNKTTKDILILIILQILWANLHSSFLIGLFLITMFFIQYLFQSSKANLKKEIVVILLSFISTIANPGFLNTHKQIINTLQNYYPIFYSSIIYDFYSPTSLKPWLICLLIIAILGLITSKKKLPLAITISSLLGFFLAFTNPIHLYLFIGLSFPFLSISIDATKNIFLNFFNTIFQNSKIIKSYGYVILIVILFLSISIPVINNNSYKKIGSTSTFGVGISDCFISDKFPKEIKSSIMKSRSIIANLPIDGGWINYNFNKQCLFDYRKGIYNKDNIYALYNGLSGNMEALNLFINEYKPNIFILNLLDENASKGVISLLNFGWSLKYMDGKTAILIPSDSKVINDHLKTGLVNLENYKEDFINKKIKGCPISLIGASKVYLNLALNNINTEKSAFVAKYILQKIINDNPKIIGANIRKGYAQLLLKKPNEAEKTFKNLLDFSNSRNVWIGYKYACEATGNKEGLEIANNFLNKDINKIENIKYVNETESIPVIERIIE